MARLRVQWALRRLLACLCACLLGAFVPAHAANLVSGPGRTDRTGYLPDWSGVSAPFYPLYPASAIEPVLTKLDVTDANCYFVADPFLIHEGATWFMFFEVAVPLGKIALATSDDGVHWTYQHIVLGESYHISYPHVFQYDGVYYMTPESALQHVVRLYRADVFPDTWVYQTTLLSGRNFSDPTIFRYHDLWWMFVGNDTSDACYLYYSAALDQGWVEHPHSPIVSADRSKARPGGRVVLLSGDRLFRLAQDCTPTYGNALRAFQVTVLSTTDYQEQEIPESPILQADGEGWNANGMHQSDAWRDGDHWLSAVDGFQTPTWSIGIYRTYLSAGAPEPQLAVGGPRPVLTCSPNPFSTLARISSGLPPRPGAGPGRLVICDATGRFVFAHPVPGPSAYPGSSEQTTIVSWPGTDSNGRPVPAGVYFCRLERGDRSIASTRIVVIR